MQIWIIFPYSDECW